MQKALITGGAGLAGQALLRSAPDDVEVCATWRNSPLETVDGNGDRLAGSVQVDLCQPDYVAAVFDEFLPDVVIHTAYSQSSESDIVGATTNVASNCARLGSRLIHLSSDCVFGGEMGPYSEIGLDDNPLASPFAIPTTTARPTGDPPSQARVVDPPVDDYGRWKATVEGVARGMVSDCTLVRTSLLMGLEPVDPRTAAVIDGLKAGHEVRLFVDELRCPVSVDEFAGALWRLAGMNRRAAAGVWHLAGTEAVSRYSLGLLIATTWGLDPSRIIPSLQRDHPKPRARDVRLSIGRAQEELRFQPSTMAELFTQWSSNERTS